MGKQMSLKPQSSWLRGQGRAEGSAQCLAGSRLQDKPDVETTATVPRILRNPGTGRPRRANSSEEIPDTGECGGSSRVPQVTGGGGASEALGKGGAHLRRWPLQGAA